MEYQEEWNYNNYEQNVKDRKPIYNYTYINDNMRAKNKMNVISTSNYSKRFYNTSRQKSNTEEKNTNSKYNKNYSHDQNRPIINNVQLNSNSSQYYSQKNKYLITFNSNPRKFDTNGNISNDGVIRGYTNNCSFYISGSSDLRSLLNSKNKDLRNKTNKTYENKDIKRTKLHMDTDRNQLINKKYYDTKKDNYHKNYSSSTEGNYGQYKYQIPITSKKINQQKAKINYAQTEPSNNVIYFSQQSEYTRNTQYNSNNNKINDKYNNKYSSNINNLNININNINNTQRREYKTSTNTNFNENTKRNYFKTEEEPSTIHIRRRNNTPNTLRTEIGYHSSKEENNNKIRKNILEEKKGRHTVSEIPHNFNRQKYNYNYQKNVLNNIDKSNQRNPNTLNKVDSYNYKRYNDNEIPQRKREYRTSTETNSFKIKNYSTVLLSKNEKEVDINEVPRYKNNFVKKISPKKYETHSINYSLPKYNKRNYSVHTETSATKRVSNNLGNNEYEISDVEDYRKYQRSKYNNNNNIKVYSTFERGLINIRENKKEIEKDENMKLKRRESNHHKVYISNNVSQNKKYKSSTQKNDDIRTKYTLGNLNEYEIDVNNKNKYDQYIRNKNEGKNIKNVNININKNNYFKEMKNLEEEIELDDGDEQNEYVPPEQIFKNKNKKEEIKKINNYIINKSERTPPSNNQNYQKNYYEPKSDPEYQKNYKKDVKVINENMKYIPQTVSLNSQPKAQVKKYILIPKNIINNKNENNNLIIQQNQNLERKEEEHLQQKNENEEEHESKKSKYSSYFGDSNNNYYEIKGISEKKKEEEEEEEEEEDIEEKENINSNTNTNYTNQIVRNVNFGIQSENIYIPADIARDKEEKEADEQQVEEDEQFDNEENEDSEDNEENENENENGDYKEDMNINNHKISKENNIEYNINKGNDVIITSNNNNNIENKKNEMEQIIEENNENDINQEDDIEEFEGEEEAINGEDNLVDDEKKGDEDNIEGENEEEELNEEEAINEEEAMNEEEAINEEEALNEEEAINEEEALNEEDMGNEEYNEYVEGEEIDDNIDENNFNEIQEK